MNTNEHKCIGIKWIKTEERTERKKQKIGENNRFCPPPRVAHAYLDQKKKVGENNGPLRFRPPPLGSGENWRKNPASSDTLRPICINLIGVKFLLRSRTVNLAAYEIKTGLI